MAIGSFSILELNGRSSSPFNIREPVQSPYFTLEEARELFSQFEEQLGHSLDSRIVEDIHTRTGGYLKMLHKRPFSSALICCDSHAGLVCRCGKAIDETLLVGRNTITFDEWMRYATFQLIDDISMWPTMTKLISTLRSKEAHVVSSMQLLYRRFLPTATPVKLVSQDEIEFSKFLTAEGALRWCAANTFEVQPLPLFVQYGFFNFDHSRFHRRLCVRSSSLKWFPSSGQIPKSLPLRRLSFVSTMVMGWMLWP